MPKEILAYIFEGITGAMPGKIPRIQSMQEFPQESSEKTLEKSYEFLEDLRRNFWSNLKQRFMSNIRRYSAELFRALLFDNNFMHNSALD